MESLKITTELAYVVKETNGNDTFVGWKSKGCNVLWDREMLRLELDGTTKERSELRADILNALKKAQQKMKENGKKESLQTIILEAQIPSSRCGIVIGTEGETIKGIKADFGVHCLYIDTTGGKKVNRQPRPNFSWLVIGSYDVEQLTMAWERVMELLDYANKSEFPTASGAMSFSRKNKGVAEDGGEGQRDRMAMQKIHIPAPDYFTRDQMRRFELIKKKAHGVHFDLDSSDPGQQFRSVTLSGTENAIAIVKTEFNALIDEVKASMTVTENEKNHPNAPAEPPNGSFGCSVVRGRKEMIGLSRKKHFGAPADPVQPKRLEKFKKEVLVPQKCILQVIGNGGENIRQLQDRFGVQMRFLGNNYLDYPNGRTLAIIGDTEEQVETARDCVDREFILKKWEAWNTYQHDTVSTQATCEEIYRLSPTFALREDLESAMKKMKDQSGIVSYCYRQFRGGHRPIVLRGTKLAVEKATEILTNMEKQWSQTKTQQLGSIRARSLDDISITSFVESISMANAFEEMAATNGQSGRKERGGEQQQKSKAKKHIVAQTAGEATADDRDYDEDTTDQETLNGSANGRESAEERCRTVSFAQNDDTIGEGKSNNTLNGIQQILFNSAKNAFDKMNNEMESKMEQLREKASRILCIQCGKSERSILFTPCRHFLCCPKCAASLPNCPICKVPSKKLQVFLD